MLASPALPIGGFSYSQGLETAIERGWVGNESQALAWLRDGLALNVGRFDAPLLCGLCRAVTLDDWPQALRLNALHLATREGSELLAETLQTGYSLRRWCADADAVADAIRTTVMAHFGLGARLVAS